MPAPARRTFAPLFAPTLALILGLLAAPQVQAQSCTLDGAGVQIALAPAEGEVLHSGAPLTLTWQVAARDPACDGRAYLMIETPVQARYEGEGFLALGPGDEGPFGDEALKDRQRLVIPLQGSQGQGGQIGLTAQLIGPFALQSHLVHYTTTGSGMAERATGETRADGPGLTADIRPGRPILLAQDEVPVAQPKALALSANGLFLLEVYDDRFRVLHRETGAVVLTGTGGSPRFSPSGRFLHWYPTSYEVENYQDIPPEEFVPLVIGEDFALADLFQGEVILRLADLPDPTGNGLVMGVDWSPGEGFMLVHLPRNCGSVLVQPMIGARMVAQDFGSNACSALENGIAVTLPALDGAVLGTAYGAGLVPTLTTPPRDYWPEDAEPPSEEALIALAGGGVSSIGSDGRVIPLLPAPQPPDGAQGQALAQAAAAVPRSAKPLEGVGTRGRGADRIARAMADRLAALGLPLQDPGPDWDEVMIEALPYGEPEAPDLGDYDGSFYVMTGRQSRLEMPGLTDAVLDQLSQWLLPDTMVCAYGWPPQARLWTRVLADQVFQILHLRCIVGTGSLPEGLVAILGATGDGQGWAGALTSDVLDESYKPDPPRENATLELHLPLDTGGEWRLWSLPDQVVALTAPPDGLALIWLATGEVLPFIDAASDTGSAALIAFTQDGTALVQGNRDGRILLRDPETGALLAQGAYLDDELVLSMADGTFRWTAEGARLARVRFAGDPVGYQLAQLAPPGPEGGFALPPRLALAAPPDLAGAVLRLPLQAEAAEGLVALEVYRDGVQLARRPIDGIAAEPVLEVPLLPETRHVSVIARDGLGARSATLEVPVAASGTAPQGRLFALAVGTDRYDDPALAPLTQAGADAERFIASLQGLPEARYAGLIADPPMIDAADLAQRLPARLAEMAAEAGPEDTLFLHIAGHGLLGADGRFYLATPATSAARAEATALLWDDVRAALAAFPGKVVVFLDACHSGAAETGQGAGFATNDAAAEALTGNERIAVLAASKGRQVSLESAGAGGGFFTVALARALADPATDLDGNGAVELAELYRATKTGVAGLSDGAQTPWLMLNGLWGEIAVW